MGLTWAGSPPTLFLHNDKNFFFAHIVHTFRWLFIFRRVPSFTLKMGEVITSSVLKPILLTENVLLTNTSPIPQPGIVHAAQKEKKVLPSFYLPLSTNKQQQQQQKRQSIYKIKKHILDGNFGKVYQVSDQEEKVYAAKYIKCSLFDHRHSRLVEREIEILQKVDSPYFLKLYHAETECKFFEYGFPSHLEYRIIMEYAEHGELFDYLIEKYRQGFRALPRCEIKFIMFQLVSGLCYLKTHLRVLHRDLKPENILITSFNEKKYPIVKIIDFGLSGYESEEKVSKERLCGSPIYFAPEVWFPKVGLRSYASDVWSLAIIFYILLELTFPPELEKIKLNCIPKDAVLKKILLNIHDLGKERVTWDKHTRDLYSRMTEINPKCRITCEDMLKHPFFSSD